MAETANNQNHAEHIGILSKSNNVELIGILSKRVSEQEEKILKLLEICFLQNEALRGSRAISSDQSECTKRADLFIVEMMDSQVKEAREKADKEAA